MNQNQLTQKEKMLLQDLKKQEELCIMKYNKYANETNDHVLKQLFQQLSNQETQHLNTINQIMSGQSNQQQSSQNEQQSIKSQGGWQEGSQTSNWQSGVMQSGSSNEQSQSNWQNQGSPATGGNSGQSTKFTPNSNFKSQNANQKDFELVSDLLSTEKYVSSTYNTAIFEFNNTQNRQALNHIQKEEQEHGELLYNYLKQNNAYPLQA